MNGETVNLVSATNAGSNIDTQLEASGAGSRIELSSLTALRGGTGIAKVSANAINGGVVDLSEMTSIPSGDTQILADGSGSVVDVSVLTSFSDIAFRDSLSMPATRAMVSSKIQFTHR